jgi:hypothetical protein
MTYQINKTDGTIISTVPDGQIDTLSTDLTLIGRNYSGFGESLNENFIKLLENFASTTRPSKPIRGQLWFDTSELKLKVYSGTEFLPVSSATITPTTPTTLGTGDLWFNSNDKQLYFFDGTQSLLIGPTYSASQGLSGFQVRTLLDSLNQTRVITLLYNNGVLLGIFSKDSFTPKVAITGFSGSVQPGFNAASDSPLSTYKFNVTATNAEQLGNTPATTYLRKDTANEVSGTLKIKTDLGIDIGSSDQANIRVSESNVTISNNADARTLGLSVRRGINLEPALIINAADRSIDIYNNALYSDSQVNIGGSVTIAGDLTVRGNTVTINASTVTVEDKNIILAKQTGILPTDANADTGGVIVQGATSHAFVWSHLGQAATSSSPAAVSEGYSDALPPLLSGAWNSTDHINLSAGKYYAIDGIPLLEQFGATFRLTSAVTQASGINIFGIQAAFQVDNIFFDNNKISTVNPNGDLELEPNGSGNISLLGSPKITGLADPTTAQDASTKEYVDASLQTKDIVFSMDLSDGKPNSYIITNILNSMCPFGPKYRNGTQAVILCTIINNSSTSLDLNPLLNAGLSFGTFNTPTGTAPALINSSIGVATVAAPTVTTTRIIKRFQLSAGVWVFVSDTLLPP